MKIIPFALGVLCLLNFACARPNYADDAGRAPTSDNEFSFGKTKVNMQFYWEHRPLDEKDAGSFTLEFFNPDDRADFQDPAPSVFAFMRMEDMPHGAPPLT
ncbi:MAG: hypothetical protein EOP06_11175, partial [Proteobacteria bacterium]